MIHGAASGERGQVVVVLGSFSSQPFAAGLLQLLAATGDYAVAPVGDASEVAGVLDPRRPSIVIVEGSDPAACGPYLDLSERTSVIMLDPLATRAFVGVDNPDWQQLDALIKALVGEARSEGAPVAARRVHVFGPRRAQGAPTAGEPPAELGSLVAWLDLRFGLRLLQRCRHGDDGVPGWSVAPSEVLASLGIDPTASEQELASASRAADDALIVLRTSLPADLADVATTFALQDTDLRLLCLALAPEIDGRYATATGVLHDDLTRRRPGLTLLAELLAVEATQAWDLRRVVERATSVASTGLIRPVEQEALPVDVGYEPSRAVVAHLLHPSLEDAARAVGAGVRPRVRRLAGGGADLTAQESECARRLRWITAHPPAVVHLVGGGPAKRWFDRIAAAVGLTLIVGELRDVPPDRSPVRAVTDWLVLSRLRRTGLLLLGAASLSPLDQRQVADAVAGLAVGARLVATDAPRANGDARSVGVDLEAPRTTAAERARRWARGAALVGLALDDVDARRLAATVAVDPGEVDRCLELAAADQASGAAGSPLEALQKVARGLTSVSLPAGARLIEPAYSWDDIVLPPATEDSLRMIPQHVLEAGRVLEEWRFADRLPYGQGVAALFSGPSGTGKTMAAQVIARELGVDLLQVDLSKTISKYLGETEKNLDEVFSAAEERGSVLLFDEADAIFGKRTEIKDAHDRHANVEVAYLLQRMEAFVGLAILTTNLKQNLDHAFVRRLRFVVEFVPPTPRERGEIWRRAFPPNAPLAAELDVASLARQLAITGGSIQQIALHAAFLAAADDRPICMPHIVAATRRELMKIGMLNAERALDELAS